MLTRGKSGTLSAALDRPLTLNAAQVEEFARKARWQVHCDDMRAHRARCLDGRYKPGAGVIAMPGADIGVLACALIVAKWFAKRFDRTIAADDLREVVFGVVGGMPNFSYHTDRPSLTTGSDRYQGCSYCRLLATQSASFRPYDLDGNQLAALQQTLEGLEGMYVKPDVLRGGHDEVAVLFIRNVHDLRNCEPLSFDEIRRAPKFWVLDNYAVLRGTGRRRAFVYQRDLAETRLARLASGLAKSLGLSASRTAELRKIVGDVGTLHVHRALQHLARGLPFYNILIDVRSGEIGEPERFA